MTSPPALPARRHRGVASPESSAAIGREAGSGGPERAAIGRGRAEAWPQVGLAAGGAGGGGSRSLLSVHLRADARVFEAAPADFPVAMSRFKVSKFRHTEARPSRREVSPAGGTRVPPHPPPQALRGDAPPKPVRPGAPPSGMGPASGSFCRNRRAESGAA